MKYLAVLMYDCGCAVETAFGFMRAVRFNASSQAQFKKRVEQLKIRKPRRDEGYQCHRAPPREIQIFDQRYNLTKRWERE